MENRNERSSRRRSPGESANKAGNRDRSKGGSRPGKETVGKSESWRESKGGSRPGKETAGKPESWRAGKGGNRPGKETVGKPESWRESKGGSRSGKEPAGKQGSRREGKGGSQSEKRDEFAKAEWGDSFGEQRKGKPGKPASKDFRKKEGMQEKYSNKKDRKEAGNSAWDKKDRKEAGNSVWDKKERKEAGNSVWDKKDRKEAGNPVWDKKDRKKDNPEWDKKDRRKDNPAALAARKLCPVYQKCGGCQLMELAYADQLIEKQKRVEKLLQPFCKVQKIMGMENPVHYRNKVHAVFGHKKDGSVISGTYQEGTHFIVPVDDCLIEDPTADAIIRDIRDLLKSFKIKTYNEDTGFGLFRHVLVRTGFHSGEVMLVLVLGSPILPSKNNFVKALRKLHPEITTVILNINAQKTSMILGEKETVLYGKGYIEDTLCGRTFRISSKSFYQINPVQTEVLYNKAIELAGMTGKERMIDAYCGIGTIGLIASSKAKEVISVELNQDAVRDAIFNAKRNEIKNVRFYQNDAGEFMTEMAQAGEHVDVVFMDPPRSGSDEAFMSSAVSLKPEKIVYISCNPITLARDLEYFTKHGYKPDEAWPIDLFPFTNHVEVVIQMTYCGDKRK
ncbi:MAG: 23S rRNA (uracil(1939)-C(5))-methyltransferase RlmD [Lachnospiraceae bacterium]|nr:23S rRNA (uracil(1939)-C(5))-methyltransferase RlmD [Lachnospiraceae bacterium]